MEAEKLTLTSSLPPGTSSIVESPVAATQEQSLLFKLLPLEIRLIIYDFAFYGIIHIISPYPNTDTNTDDPSRPPRKLAHVRCNGNGDIAGHAHAAKPNSYLSRAPSGSPIRRAPCWMRQRSRVHGIRYHNSTDGPPDPIPPDNLLALLLTCRRIYTESHLSLYSSPHFDFNSETTLLTFIQSQSTPAPTSTNPLSSIHSLELFLTYPRTKRLRSEIFLNRFPDWETLWHQIPTQMPRLKYIRLGINVGGYRTKSLFANSRQECKFFEPLGVLRGTGMDGLEEFWIETSWPLAGEVVEMFPVGARVGRLVMGGDDFL